MYPHYASRSALHWSILVCGDGDEALTLLARGSNRFVIVHDTASLALTLSASAWNVTFRQFYDSTIGAAVLGDW